MKNNIKISHLFNIILFIVSFIYCQETDQYSSGFDFVSDPEGADVYLDGKLVGNTPCKVDQLKSGNYTIVFKMSGFIENKIEVDLSDNMHLRIFEQLEKITLEIKEDYGVLQVTSSPNGAEIALYNETIGVSPFNSDSIKVGSYYISVTKKNYSSFGKTIEIKKDKPVILDVQLHSIDSLKLSKKRKVKRIRRIIFGSLSACFGSIGLIAHAKIDDALKKEESAWKAYKELELDTPEYDKRYSYYKECFEKTNSLINQRNIFCPISGIFGVGFIISIPF